MRADAVLLDSAPVSRVRAACGVFWVIAGSLHFMRPKMYEAIMPPQLPAHHELVLASGAAEIAGGLAVLTPGLQRPARWWLIGVLVGVFPANVHMALHPDEIEGLPTLPRWTLWARLPIQAAFVAWVVAATRTS